MKSAEVRTGMEGSGDERRRDLRRLNTERILVLGNDGKDMMIGKKEGDYIEMKSRWESIG